MWTYEQHNGRLCHDGALEGTGYSGTGIGRNNPNMESVTGVGPIPAGLYEVGLAYAHPHLGPCVMNLMPIGHDLLGRSDFRIHGDSKNHNASHGCIVLGPSLRRQIAASPDRELTVVA